ncbi:MAG TPA: hypothetical protein VGM68_13160 [Rhizomicrobium sp.]|jgi:hypothetical protein
MPLKFTGDVKVEKSTGDLQVLAYLGEVPVRCVVRRAAVTAGLNGFHISDGQALELYYARKTEIQGIASQRFDNGENLPTVSRSDMPVH